jgi:hypothetical protein
MKHQVRKNKDDTSGFARKPGMLCILFYFCFVFGFRQRGHSRRADV